ncbi:annexin D2 isoform X2 [Jatropha curcas]|uniref:annexin D2 isoform X2 n=1 Tax=Jatropha curcas TaxID=180498 RepID=UPI0009D77DA9|nr:annexin D2 isoform X2 [Jatropha curcas]
MSTMADECFSVSQDCEKLKKSFDGFLLGWGIDRGAIISILGNRSAAQRKLIREAYAQTYKEDLLKALEKGLSGDFELLVPLVTAYRYEGGEVNMGLAKSEAKILHEKISKKAFSAEELTSILSTRSKAQINATLNCYNDQFGNSINKDLRSKENEEYLALLRATIKCLKCPEKYFEKVLRLSMKGIGTDEETLTRVVVTRADVDMKRIKEEYYKRNSVTLEDAIKGDTSFDYAKMLLTLIGHENN